MLSPLLDNDLGFCSVTAPLKAQAPVSKLAVEAFIGATLPRLSKVDRSLLLSTVSSMAFKQRTQSQDRMGAPRRESAENAHRHPRLAIGKKS
jgi:hypothetical protein